MLLKVEIKKPSGRLSMISMHYEFHAFDESLVQDSISFSEVRLPLINGEGIQARENPS